MESPGLLSDRPTLATAGRALKALPTGHFDWAQAYEASLERYGIIGVWSTLASHTRAGARVWGACHAGAGCVGDLAKARPQDAAWRPKFNDSIPLLVRSKLSVPNQSGQLENPPCLIS